MVPLLEELGFTTTVTQMPTPDYVIPLKNGYNIAITMKSYDDFLQSIHSGHMHNEIQNMLSLPPRTLIYLLMWKPNYSYKRQQIAQVMNISDTVNCEYIPVVKAKNRIDSAHLMKKFWLKYIKEDNPMQFRRRVELSGNKKTDPVTRLYLNLPKIGPVTAKSLKEHYPTMADLVDAVKDTAVYDKDRWKTKKEWRKVLWYTDVENLGPTIAQKVERIMCGDLLNQD